jgi:hypothetical protein
MAMNFPAPGASATKFPIAPAGNHRAILVGIYDIGTHEVKFGTDPPKPKRQLVLTWELSDELMEDGRPFALSRTFTFSSHEKAGLRIMVENWLNRKFTDDTIRKFDLFGLAGRACLLNVGHDPKADGTTYANIKSVGPLAKGMQPPERHNEVRVFSLNEETVIPDGTPKFVIAKIEASPEWAARQAGYGPGVAQGETYQSAADVTDDPPTKGGVRPPAGFNEDEDDPIPF